MAPGKGQGVDIGSKHVSGYFEPGGATCKLTVVMAETEQTGTEPPGKRVIVNVKAGDAARVDAAKDQSGDFTCSADASKMTVNVFARPPYQPAKK